MVIGFGAPLAELEKYFPAKSSDRVLTELSTGHRLADLRMTEPTIFVVSKIYVSKIYYFVLHFFTTLAKYIGVI